jgi:hypothetical protein
VRKRAPDWPPEVFEAVAARLADVLLDAVERDRAARARFVPLGEGTVDAESHATSRRYRARGRAPGEGNASPSHLEQAQKRRRKAG